MLSDSQQDSEFAPVKEKGHDTYDCNGKKGKERYRICVVCRNAISRRSLSFEPRLIDDKDFYRECWGRRITGLIYLKDALLLLLVQAAVKVG